MRRLLFGIISLGVWSFASLASAQLHFEGEAGIGKGQKIVFLSGDEEYRSEESCPMLAKILSQRFGYDCTVLFSMAEEGDYIDPNHQQSLVGLSELKDADLMVIGTRFRQLDEKGYGQIAEYLNTGKPVIGFRTATHAFTGEGQTGDFKWKEFGPNILGEGWVNHHGKHKVEGARGSIEEANAKHPILRGVTSVFGPSDVYGVKRITPENATILLRGIVTETLDPRSAPVEGKKNDPMMPLAWLREYTAPDGKTKGTAFCTTMGASVDFLSAGLRRLVVNAAIHLTGQEVPPLADVKPIDRFQPTFYGRVKEKGFYKKRNLKITDFALGTSAATGLPAEMMQGFSAKKKENKPKDVKKEADKKKEGAKKAKNNTHFNFPDAPMAKEARSQAVAAPEEGEKVVFIGNGLAERDLYFNRLESELYLRFPAQQLLIRNMARQGDTAGFRPHASRESQWAFPGAEQFNMDLREHLGTGFYPTPDQWLTHVKADTVVAFLGYNESFGGPERLVDFEGELQAFVKHSLSKAYNGEKAPRLVLVSPLAYEDLSAEKDLPNGEKENANLALYTEMMSIVAEANDLTFINLFEPSQTYFATGGAPLTINGFAPNDHGYQMIAKWLADGLYGEAASPSSADPELIHAAVKEKNWLWNNDYNIINGVHVHGRRYNPYGPQNYPDEVKKTREMMALREDLIYRLAKGETTSLEVDDSGTHKLPPVPTNFDPNNQKMGAVDYKSAEEAIADMTLEEGFEVSLFASEKTFPELKNPVQISFDDKGRLWVAVMPSYPHWRPGDPMPDDKIIILEDTDGDGKADKRTVFADGLQLPIGFEITPEGVYLSQEPNLVLLVDEDGDDRADRMDLLAGGFDTHDTHHAISAYSADAGGSVYIGEGRFLHSQVETPYGPRRCNDGGVWRFDPKKFYLERVVQTDLSNPWGLSFDYWEQMMIADGSGGRNWWSLPVSAKMPYGVEIPKSLPYVPKRARPTSGSEFISSRHFPDELQGGYMVCNSIGFLGISIAQAVDDGAGYKGELVTDLISSSDSNFRPVDLEFAPDGSLYFVDWHNALIGHMQHNARDPNRDVDHGRIYRITHKTRPLVKPSKVAGASIAELLENLKEPEYRTRYRSRRALRGHSASEVLPAVKDWVAGLDTQDPKYAHHLCEAMWATWGQNQVDVDLLKTILSLDVPDARTAAVQVLRYAHNSIAESEELFIAAANDGNARVRLAAMMAASWLDGPVGARVMLEALKHPVDSWSGPAAQFTIDKTLGKEMKALIKSGAYSVAENPRGQEFMDGKLDLRKGVEVKEETFGPTQKLTKDEMKFYQKGQGVYHRDAHCATCHQPNGQGLPNIYPPLVGESLDDDERLVKIILKGLWGPMVAKGKFFDPAKGVPPMPGFAPLLTDEEVSAVTFYVRNSFANKGKAVDAKEVARIRKETEAQLQFFMVEDLMKAHPIKGWEKW